MFSKKNYTIIQNETNPLRVKIFLVTTWVVTVNISAIFVDQWISQRSLEKDCSLKKKLGTLLSSWCLWAYKRLERIKFCAWYPTGVYNKRDCSTRGLVHVIQEWPQTDKEIDTKYIERNCQFESYIKLKGPGASLPMKKVFFLPFFLWSQNKIFARRRFPVCLCFSTRTHHSPNKSLNRITDANKMWMACFPERTGCPDSPNSLMMLMNQKCVKLRDYKIWD